MGAHTLVLCTVSSPRARGRFLKFQRKEIYPFFVKIQEQDRKSGSKPTHSPSVNLWQRRWGYTMEKKTVSGSVGKESACNAQDLGVIPGSGRPLEEGWRPLQYSYLENSMDRGAWRAIQSIGSKGAGCDWATNTLNKWCWKTWITHVTEWNLNILWHHAQK